MSDGPKPQRPYLGVHLLLVRDGKILLMRRKTAGEVCGTYATIAGKVDEAESPTVALVREVKEEVGITVRAEDLRLLLTLHHNQTVYNGGRVDVVELYFTASIWSGEPCLLEPDKADNLAFYPLNNLPQPLLPWLQHALDALATNATRYAEEIHD